MPAIRLLIALFAVLAAVPGAGATDLGGLWPQLIGSGHTITDNRQVGAFRALSLHTAASVVVRQGRPASVVIEADDNVAPLIEVHVDDRVLVVKDRRRYAAKRAQIVVTTPRLERLSVRGDTTVSISGLIAPRLTVDAGGSSAVNLASLTAETLQVETAGSSAVKLAGIVNDTAYSTSGSSAVQARELQAARVTVHSGGSSSISVWARERLVVHAGGSSEVRYRGEPELQSSMGGSATLGRLSSTP